MVETKIYFSKFCSNISVAGFCYFVVCYFRCGDRVSKELITIVDLVVAHDHKHDECDG